MRRAGSVFLPNRWFPPSRSGRPRRLHGGRGGASGAAPGPEPGYWAALGGTERPAASPSVPDLQAQVGGQERGEFNELAAADGGAAQGVHAPDRPEFQAAQVHVREAAAAQGQPPQAAGRPLRSVFVWEAP